MSHLGLHCLLRPFCPNTYGKYGTQPHDKSGIQINTVPYFSTKTYVFSTPHVLLSEAPHKYSQRAFSFRHEKTINVLVRKVSGAT